MERERRKQLLLTGLIVVLGAATYRFWPGTAVSAPPASTMRGAAQTSGSVAPGVAPDVNLESLEQERPKPGLVDRNLFRFRSRAAPPPAPAGKPPMAPPSPSATDGLSPTAQVPPIPLKFIGILEVPGQSQKLAVLSDQRGVYHGREGDIIEGRYRILRIGSESIELAYADGRGRQTLRLSGQ